MNHHIWLLTQPPSPEPIGSSTTTEYLVQKKTFDPVQQKTATHSSMQSDKIFDKDP